MFRLGVERLGCRCRGMACRAPVDRSSTAGLLPSQGHGTARPYTPSLNTYVNVSAYSRQQKDSAIIAVMSHIVDVDQRSQKGQD